MAVETEANSQKPVGVAERVMDVPVRNADALGSLRAAAARVHVPQVLGALETVCDTIRAIEGNANRVLALETMLLALRRVERVPATA